MFSSKRLLALVLFLVSIVVPAELYAQSGSRSAYGGTSSSQERREARARIAQQNEQQRQLVQQKLEQASRDNLLRSLGQDSNAALKRKYAKIAFNEAANEYRALKRMNISDVSMLLSTPFRLSSEDINRANGKVNWPKTFEDTKHQTVIRNIELDIQDTHNGVEIASSQFIANFKQLSLQLGERAKAREISLKDYAVAKRFLTGLGYEAIYRLEN